MWIKLITYLVTEYLLSVRLSTYVLLLFCFVFVLFFFFVWALRCGQCWLLLCFFFIKKILIWFSFSSPNISASVFDFERTRSSGAPTIKAPFQVFRASLSCRANVELHSRLSHFFWLSPILRGHRKSSIYGLNGYTYYHLIHMYVNN